MNSVPAAAVPQGVDSLIRCASQLRRKNRALEQALAVPAGSDAELTDAQRIAGIGGWSWDVRTDTTWASKEMCRILGRQEISPFAQQSGLLFPHTVWLELRQARLTMARTGLGYNLELSALHANGSQIWVHSRAEAVCDSDGKVTALRGMVQDITERRRADIRARKLADAEHRLAAAVFEDLAEGIMVTDGDGVILPVNPVNPVNPAFTTITGFTAQEALGKTPKILHSDRHDADFHAGVWRQLKEQGQWTGEVWNRRKNGDVFLERQTIAKITDGGNDVTHYVSVFHDVTDTWQSNEDNHHMAFHDALTNLPNRALLLERLGHQIVEAEQEPKRLAAMFLNLAGFKAVNDTHGACLRG